ncbi:hypothetical protein BKA67DRAFT_533196 [Truncatella angustata]|uniref:Uncharacterized protein n=1 Tax=Truncatella angustata TaxID=152316 RepID=A0A9P8UTR5_9PEZI|nr:uncharacterized protein BKA67DRAFT_533196 [Truncatella angustata]KAH6658021.1 hypothetical protein BKA67DRAFT_533196 [Truncatella angustata]
MQTAQSRRATIAFKSLFQGEVLAAFFRATLLARSRITHARNNFEESKEPTPEYLLQTSRLTDTIDRVMRDFRQNYQFGHYKLFKAYGFGAAQFSDTEDEAEYGWISGQDDIEETEEQDADGSTALTEDGIATMNEGNAAMNEDYDAAMYEDDDAGIDEECGDVAMTTDGQGDVPAFSTVKLARRAR